MKISRLTIQIKLNTTQPISRDDLWWKAFDIFIRGKV
jgi:hypothetical protein